MIKHGFISLAALAYMAPLLASEVPVTVFWYQEKETGTPPSNMRYLVTDEFLRIDEGNGEDDYVLFDAALKTIYSVNRRDRTVLVITGQSWQMPEFEFDYSIDDQALPEAPEIAGKTVQRYRVRGDDTVCTEVHYVPGLYAKQMGLLKDYQTVLSGQQVKVLDNTPKEFHTPCFLADQVYNDGGYYARGLPVQVWHSRGYARMLVDYKDEEVNEDLFTLPEDYRHYQPFVPQDDAD